MGAGRSPAEHLEVLGRFRETAPISDYGAAVAETGTPTGPIRRG